MQTRNGDVMQNPWENLANAIIEQAAIDYRQAKTYAKQSQTLLDILNKENAKSEKNKGEEKKLRKINMKLKAEVEEDKKVRKKWKDLFSSGTSTKTEFLEKIFKDDIQTNEHMMKSIERFFYSGWFSQLTQNDGSWLFSRIAVRCIDCKNYENPKEGVMQCPVTKKKWKKEEEDEVRSYRGCPSYCEKREDISRMA